MFDDKGTGDCDSGEPIPFNPNVVFANTGWGALRNVQVSFSFSNPGSSTRSQQFDQALGSFDQLKAISVQRELKALGVDIDQLNSWSFKCDSLEHIVACQRQALDKLTLGQVRPHVHVGDRRLLGTTLDGVLRYQWQDSEGKLRSSLAPFQTSVMLAAI